MPGTSTLRNRGPAFRRGSHAPAREYRKHPLAAPNQKHPVAKAANGWFKSQKCLTT